MNKDNNFDIKAEKIKLEQARIQIEQDRLKLEKERLKSEREMRRWTVITVFIPVIIAILTVAFSIWSQAEQSKRDFALKAAEILISSDSPSDTLTRMKALQALFPNQLPADFQGSIESFEPDLYSGGPSYDRKMKFLELVFGSNGKQQEVIEMYKTLFPDSEIIKAVESK